MLPRKSKRVCNLTAALVERNGAQGKHRKTQIDGAGIQSVDRVVEIDAERFCGVEAAGDPDQATGRSRRRCASRDFRWRRPECCAKLGS